MEPILLKEVNTTGAEANFAQGEADMAREEAKAARKEAKIIKKMGGIAQQKVNLAWQKADTAEQKAHTAQQMAHTVITNYKAVTALHGLATDCLRLSMHFFHPIQQCAQQVYHSALPLSPMSSKLRSSCLQSVIDNQLSYVTAFSGVPDNWGLLLRTINVRPSQLTCITTFAQRIVAACEDVVNTYDAVTGVLRQSLRAPEVVVKIQGSPEGSILFFAHSFSVTMWDVQTGGLIHTFTTQSEVNDIAVSASEDHIACGSPDGSVTLWNIRTKKGRGFGNGEPIITMCWLSPQKLAVATQNSLYIRDVAAGKTVDNLSIPNRVWGMLYFGEKDEFLVGASWPGMRAGRETYFETISHRRQKLYRGEQSPVYLGELIGPTIVGKEIVCITTLGGVQPFSTESYNWTNKPPLLKAAASVAVSLNRNLVAQTKDSIQIFSTDALTSGEARNEICVSHVYPLGKNHIICILQPTRHLAVLELETLRELLRDDKKSPFKPLLENETQFVGALFPPGVAAKFDILMAMQAWWLGVSLPKRIELPDEDPPRLLYGLPPAYTKIAAAYSSLRRELWVKDAEDGIVLARLRLEDGDLGSGEVYDLIFDSETRLYLKIDGPGQHVQIPYDITASLSGWTFPYTIIKGEPIPLSEPRATSPYNLDANREWVLDAQSRKICWISPANLRRGGGSHFWTGLWLVMVGDDGVVRKVSFREPDC